MVDIGLKNCYVELSDSDQSVFNFFCCVTSGGSWALEMNVLQIQNYSMKVN